MIPVRKNTEVVIIYLDVYTHSIHGALETFHTWIPVDFWQVPQRMTMDDQLPMTDPNGAAIYIYMMCHGSHQYTPFMLAWKPAPCILRVSIISWNLWVRTGRYLWMSFLVRMILSSSIRVKDTFMWEKWTSTHMHWKTWWPRSGTETFHARKLQSSPKYWASPSPPCRLARATAQRFFPPAIWRSTSGTSGKRHQLHTCLGFANTLRAASSFQISTWTQKH